MSSSVEPPPADDIPEDTVRSETGRALSREQIFEVLSNRRRRYVLHYLKQLDDGQSTTLSEIATHVAAWERDESVDGVSYDDRKSVQTSLYQLHLPKLSDCGLIDYDRRAGVIERTERMEAVEMYLEAVSEQELSWPFVFLGLSSFVLLLSVAVAMDAVGVGLLPDTSWFVFGSVLFLVASTWYAYKHRVEMRFGSEGPPPETRS